MAPLTILLPTPPNETRINISRRNTIRLVILDYLGALKSFFKFAYILIYIRYYK